MNTNGHLQQTDFHFYLRKLNESFPYKCSPLYKPEHEKKIIDWATSFSNIDDKKGFLQYWIAGNLYWSRRSKRYFGPDFNEVVVSGQLTWQPDRAIYIPVAYGYN
ncbi:hypothetical protein FHW36_104305 [Chitinophaga polysaccharea]|uniref:Uncharacterized protein n=1 Tax=Chitinophaga polysaccharea TaxID=1293035 RepID=A0A561PR78_9BACT|nr:hypothetical protein [Chitinophaga polysaccharea]TWF40622.1 hypothetical protein FHW36_104305 [Chitinophaga polysaccharea]